MAVRDPLGPADDPDPLTIGTCGLSNAIETILGHHFTRPELLREALTHRSAPQGSGRARGSNERLEFVGDRVLGLVMAEWLAERFPREQEGDLGRRLAHLVSQPVLAAVAEQIGLGGVLSVAPGEARAGRQAPRHGAGRRAGGGAGRGLLRRRAGSARVPWCAAPGKATMLAQAEPPKDAKTTLQEWAQKHTRDLPVYRVVRRSGPPHATGVRRGGAGRWGAGHRHGRQQADRRANCGGGSVADHGPADARHYGRGASGCGGDPGGRSGADSDGKLMGRETKGAVGGIGGGRGRHTPSP